jgi:uncharacterized membrane protein YuzA (DUF378 family)
VRIVLYIVRQLLDNIPFQDEGYMKKLDVAAAVLLVIGGINWGVVGLTGSDLVGTLFGQLSPLSRAVYLVVGLAALYQAVQWKAIQRRWQPAFAAR